MVLSQTETMNPKETKISVSMLTATATILVNKNSCQEYNPGRPPRGRYSIYPWVGRCGQAPHTLTLFKTIITDFPTLLKTELRFLIPCLRHLKLRLQEDVWLSCCVVNGNLMCLVSMSKLTEGNNNLQELLKNFLFIVQEKISHLRQKLINRYPD